MRIPITLAAIGSLGIAALALGLDGAETDRQPIDPTIAAPSGSSSSKDNFPAFDSVSKGYTQVFSNLDGKPGMYTLFLDKKNNRVLAELPRNFTTDCSALVRIESQIDRRPASRTLFPVTTSSKRTPFDRLTAPQCRVRTIASQSDQEQSKRLSIFLSKITRGHPG